VRKLVSKRSFADALGCHANSLPRAVRQGRVPQPVYVFSKAMWPEELADAYVVGLMEGRDPHALTAELNERFEVARFARGLSRA
jgi:hypothetical protein